MELSDRLKIARESTGKTQKEMAHAIDVSLTAVQSYESGRQVPGGRVLEALALMGFDTNWLLTGEGEMKRGETVYPCAGKIKTAGAVCEPGEGFVQIPRYEVGASAGGGAVIHSEQIVDHLSFKSDWVRNALGVPVKDLALINVLGDSMEPTLSDGDLILIDMSTRRVKDNAVYVLQLNGSLLVKRIQRKLDGSVLVRSDNTIYEPETVNSEMLDSLNIIGRVVWCGRRM